MPQTVVTRSGTEDIISFRYFLVFISPWNHTVYPSPRPLKPQCNLKPKLDFLQKEPGNNRACWSTLFQVLATTPQTYSWQSSQNVAKIFRCLLSRGNSLAIHTSSWISGSCRISDSLAGKAGAWSTIMWWDRYFRTAPPIEAISSVRLILNRFKAKLHLALNPKTCT